MSDVIKSDFLFFSENKKTIETISSNHPKIINSKHKKEAEADTIPKAELEERIQVEVKKIEDQAYHDGYQQGFLVGKEDGFKSGLSNGMEEGKRQIEAELTLQKKECKKQLAAEQQKLEVEYNRLKQELEPKLVELTKAMVYKLVGAKTANDQIIGHLIACGLNDWDSHGDLVIKVSPEDVDQASASLQSITQNLSQKIKVELIKDANLEKNDCIIETDAGTIDCSLKTQISSLAEDLNALIESIDTD